MESYSLPEIIAHLVESPERMVLHTALGESEPPGNLLICQPLETAQSVDHPPLLRQRLHLADLQALYVACE